MKALPASLALSLIAMNLQLFAVPGAGGFTSDYEFLKQHTDVLLLRKDGAAVAVVPSYQGRVMTSTYDEAKGPSFGWINRPVIKGGVLDEAERKGKLEEHIHIFGGEERFWLGPEGGQFAIFFKPGAKFEFADWRTPAVIDTDTFKVADKNESSVTFEHQATLTNFSGATFSVGIQRGVRLLGAADVDEEFSMKFDRDIRMVGYETDNQLSNRGDEAWVPEKGLLSIWILGMYNPSPTTTVVIPFKKGSSAELGPEVNDEYFGKIPEDYLKTDDGVIYMKGDGTRRGKIGVGPKRSKGVAGSYDATGKVLTLVTYNVQEAPNGFVNSMWEHQEEPYSGDVINAYNDGSPEPGAPPLGPFYELETSSPAAALKPGGRMRHVQRTYHFHGTEEQLDGMAKAVLGVPLKTIKEQF